MNKPDKNKAIAFITATCLFAVFAVFVYFQAIPRANTEYEVICLGDSIIGNVRDETSVTAVMENELGIKVFNGCFGGTCASKDNPTHRRTFYEDSMNLASIVDSIVAKDYKVQLYDIAANNYKLPYFYDAMKAFEDVAFKKAKIIFLEHGVNDYSAGRPLDDEDDPYNIYTYGGALRYSIRKLREYCPDARIVITTPTYCYFVDYTGYRYGDCNTEDFGYGTISAYADLQIKIAEELDVEYIDNYRNLGINAENAEYYTIDGIHLNDEGRKLLASTLSDFVKNTSN